MNIEEELRKAFQAGSRFGAVVYGSADTVDGERPLDEDVYVGKALRELAHQRAIELVEGKTDSTQNYFVQSQMLREAEASARLDGETHVVE